MDGHGPTSTDDPGAAHNCRLPPNKYTLSSQEDKGEGG